MQGLPKVIKRGLIFNLIFKIVLAWFLFPQILDFSLTAFIDSIAHVFCNSCRCGSFNQQFNLLCGSMLIGFGFCWSILIPGWYFFGSSWSSRIINYSVELTCQLQDSPSRISKAMTLDQCKLWASSSLFVWTRNQARIQRRVGGQE